jgi:hypothetical protein
MNSQMRLQRGMRTQDREAEAIRLMTKLGNSADAKTYRRYSRQRILHFYLLPRHRPIQFPFHILQRLVHFGIFEEFWILEDGIGNIFVSDFSLSGR